MNPNMMLSKSTKEEHPMHKQRQEFLVQIVKHGNCQDILRALQMGTASDSANTEVLKDLYEWIKKQMSTEKDAGKLEDLRRKKTVLNVRINSLHQISRVFALRSWEVRLFAMHRRCHTRH